MPGLPAVPAACGSAPPWPVFGDESGFWLVAKSCLLASGAGCCRPGGSCTAWPLRVRVLRVGGRLVGPGRPPAAAARGSSLAGTLPDMTRDMGPGAARGMLVARPSGAFRDWRSCRRAAIVGAELLHSHIRWTGKTQVRCPHALPAPCGRWRLPGGMGFSGAAAGGNCLPGRALQTGFSAEAAGVAGWILQARRPVRPASGRAGFSAGAASGTMRSCSSSSLPGCMSSS